VEVKDGSEGDAVKAEEGRGEEGDEDEWWRAGLTCTKQVSMVTAQYNYKTNVVSMVTI
jgi:hypothetical protein